MKKLLVLLVVLAVTSVASAGTAWLEVDPADAKNSYGYSDVITINLVADAEAVGLSIGAIIGDHGVAQEPLVLHPIISVFPVIGTIVNAGADPRVLVEYASGQAPPVFPPEGVPVGEAIWSFEFHVPDLPYSSIIFLDDFTGDNPAGGVPYATQVTYADFSAMTTDLPVLEIHVTPEPMTIALLGMGGLFLLRRRK